MLQTLIFTNQTDFTAVALRCAFVQTRTTLRGVKEISISSGVDVDRSRVTANGVEIHWSSPLPTGETVRLTVDLEGEPLCTLHTVWRAEGGPFRASNRSPTSFAPLVAAARSLDDLAGLTRSRRFAAAALGERIFHGEMLVAHRYFSDFDYNTSTPLIVTLKLPPGEADRRILAIDRLSEIILDRVFQRWRADPGGEPAELAQASLADIQSLSRLQIDCIRGHYPDPEGSDLDRIWDAYAMFANGELRVQTDQHGWNGEPDSAQIFFLAEFAFLAMEAGVDAGLWSRLAPLFVAANEIYVRVYRPESAKPAWGDYLPCNFHPEEMVTTTFKEKTRQDFAALSAAGLRIEFAHQLRRNIASPL